MGQAFDEHGRVLGETFGDTKREVFNKLMEKFPSAHEVRIRSLQEKLDAAEANTATQEHIAKVAPDTEQGASAEMPRYRCHKEVHALKICGVRADGFVQVEPPFAPIRVSVAWLLKHDPIVGGYYVVYEDGYTSFSPAEAFESGYTRIA